jgi:hypothetical protein
VVNGFNRFDRFLAVRQTAGPGIGSAAGPTATFDRVKPLQMNAFDYAVVYGQSLQFCSASFDSCQNDSVVSGHLRLTDHPATLWASGEESTADETFSRAEQSLVTNYLTLGGSMFISGAEIAWDLGRSGDPVDPDRVFLNTSLHAEYAYDDAATFQAGPLGGSLFAGNPPVEFDDGTGPSYLVDYPDVLLPAGVGTTTVLQYIGGSGGTAAIAYDGSAGGGRVLFLGFPFETIREPAVRDAYLADALRFLRVLPLPMLHLEPNPPGMLRLGWSTVPTQVYQLQAKPALDATAWEAVGQPITATTNSLERLLPPDQAAVFYRVQLLD